MNEITREVHQIIDLFKAMRELLGFKQEEIAKKIGIGRSALSLFEAMKSTISKEKVFKIAEILHINPDWLRGESEVFLKSDEILYLVAKKAKPLWTFTIAARNCFYLHIFKIDTPLHYIASKYLLRQELVVTVAKVGNVFCVIRTPNVKSINDFDRYYMHQAQSTMHMPAAAFYLERFENKKEMLEKIKNKNVTKEELEYLFRLARVSTIANLSLSVEEKDLILTLREHNLSALQAKKRLFDD